MNKITIESLTKEYTELCKKYEDNLPLVASLTKLYLEMVNELQKEKNNEQTI